MQHDALQQVPTRLVRDAHGKTWITNSAFLGEGLHQGLGWRHLAQRLAQADGSEQQYFEEVTKLPEEPADFYPVREGLETICEEPAGPNDETLEDEGLLDDKAQARFDKVRKTLRIFLPTHGRQSNTPSGKVLLGALNV